MTKSGHKKLFVTVKTVGNKKHYINIKLFFVTVLDSKQAAREGQSKSAEYTRVFMTAIPPLAQRAREREKKIKWQELIFLCR